MKLCIDCKYCVIDGSIPKCHNLEVSPKAEGVISLVDGRPISGDPVPCEVERKGVIVSFTYPCAYEGALWEAREVL